MVTHLDGYSRQSEIEARQDTTNSTVAFGLTLVAQNNFAEEIQEDTENLKEMSSKLQELWADRQQMLQQSYELEVRLDCKNKHWQDHGIKSVVTGFLPHIPQQL